MLNLAENYRCLVWSDLQGEDRVGSKSYKSGVRRRVPRFWSPFRSVAWGVKKVKISWESVKLSMVAVLINAGETLLFTELAHRQARFAVRAMFI